MKHRSRTSPSFLIELSSTSSHTSELARGKLKLARRSYQTSDLFRQPLNEGRSRWLTLTPASDYEGRNRWDWAHDLCRQLASRLDEPVYVEPDIEQSWPYLNRESYSTSTNSSPFVSATEAHATCSTNQPDQSWPSRPEFAWHLADDYSQLKKARDAIGKAGSSIRICHLDTGYDPDPLHKPKPAHVNHALEYNFVENNRDARDPGKRGLLYNPGHGTGTLGILAGNYIERFDGNKRIFADYLGGAPFAEIIPVRVADSVVHLFTSSMARGIDYAAACADGQSCHVASISMGGLPSRAWAAAVNRAYDAGVTIVAAAGNNFGGLPTKSLVWPARFKRVIAACGVTSADTPYYKHGIHFKMQGNFGPPEEMSHALAAWTPNIPWAELGCSDTIDLDGAGTSSATPQIAASASLWLAKYIDSLPSDFRRVEAVRNALFASAYKGSPNSSKYFGNGVLKSFDALAFAPRNNLTYAPLPEDDVFFPYLARLKPWDDIAHVTRKMFECEMAQLYTGNPRLHEIYPEIERDVLLGSAVSDVLRDFIDLPDISHTLRKFLISARPATT